MVLGLLWFNKADKKYEKVYYHFLRDNFKETEKLAHELLDEHPDHIKTLLLMARLAEKKDHFQQAREWYNKVLKVDADNQQAVEWRAHALYRLFKFEEALEDYLYLYETHTSNEKYLIALWDVFQKLNLQHIALRYYKKAVQKNDKNVDAYIWLWYQYIILWEYTHAQDNVTRAKDLYYEHKDNYDSALVDTIDNLEKQLKQLTSEK